MDVIFSYEHYSSNEQFVLLSSQFVQKDLAFASWMDMDFLERWRMEED